MTDQTFSRVRPLRLSSRALRVSAHDWLIQVRAALALAHRWLRGPPGRGTLNMDSPHPAKSNRSLRKDNMNKTELVSHVAAETYTTTAAAERMVGAVFSV